MIDLSRGKVNKRIPKNRFKVTFSDLETITWAYKISADTADFRHGDEPQEIQVFTITFKNRIVNKKELVAIQKAIPYPILFEIIRSEELGIRNEELGIRNEELGIRRYYIVINGDLYESDKQFFNGDTLTVPKRSSKLSDLYEDIASQFIGMERKENESIIDLAERNKRQQALEKEIATLERKLKAEKQFDRQIEINARIKKLKEDLRELYGREEMV